MDNDLEILKVLQIIKKNQDVEEENRLKFSKDTVAVLKEMKTLIEKSKETPKTTEKTGGTELEELKNKMDKAIDNINSLGMEFYRANKNLDEIKSNQTETFNIRKISADINSSINSNLSVINYVCIIISLVLLVSNLAFVKLYRNALEKNQEIYDEYLGEYNSLQNVLTGNSKFWYDKDQKELYIKTTEELEKSKETNKKNKN